MAQRTIVVNNVEWRVFPSGFITQNDGDEFGLFFESGSGQSKRVRITRYSPVGVRSRDQAFLELTPGRLLELFQQSQPGDTSPEAHYTP